MTGGRRSQRSRPFAVVGLAALLMVGVLLLLWDWGAPRKSRHATGPADAGAAPSFQPPPPLEAPTPLAAETSAAQLPGARAIPSSPSPSPPDDGLDAPEWKNAKLAFGMRELGAMGPYVKVGLAAARREMDFCFRQAERARPGTQASGEAQDPQPPPPAVLLLYLEAREGALDIIATRTEYPGSLSPELIDCCRQVLRGFEIPAYKTVPGKRYRVNYHLQ